MLLAGTALVFTGFFSHGIQLHEINFHAINEHPMKLAIIPVFFMTVSCGLLSGFHSTQATIISRTVSSQKEGKKVFYGMMCLESLIAMIWAAGCMHVYSLNLVPQNMIGTVNVVNTVANTFVLPILTYIVTIAVVVLPITSGDTALRGLRMIIAEALKLDQKVVRNRLVIIIPIAALIIGIILWSKMSADSFSRIWRYFNFVNQLIAIPTFLYATVYLYKNKKNYFITLLPGLFYIYITMSFIMSAKIGLNLNWGISNVTAIILTVLSLFALWKYRLKEE